MQPDGFNGALSPVVYGDIALSINTQYNNFFPEAQPQAAYHIYAHGCIHQTFCSSRHLLNGLTGGHDFILNN